MRLCVIIAVGAILTGVGVTVTHRLKPTTGNSASAGAPVPESDLPWTVPLPSASATAEPDSTGPSSAASRPTQTPAPALLGPDGDDALQAALTRYCVQDRGDDAVADLGAGEWNCRRAEHTTELGMDAACQWFYGDDAWSMTLDDDDPYSWRCFRD